MSAIFFSFVLCGWDDHIYSWYCRVEKIGPLLYMYWDSTGPTRRLVNNYSYRSPGSQPVCGSLSRRNVRWVVFPVMILIGYSSTHAIIVSSILLLLLLYVQPKLRRTQDTSLLQTVQIAAVAHFTCGWHAPALQQVSRTALDPTTSRQSEPHARKRAPHRDTHRAPLHESTWKRRVWLRTPKGSLACCHLKFLLRLKARPAVCA